MGIWKQIKKLCCGCIQSCEEKEEIKMPWMKKEEKKEEEEQVPTLEQLLKCIDEYKYEDEPECYELFEPTLVTEMFEPKFVADFYEKLNYKSDDYLNYNLLIRTKSLSFLDDEEIEDDSYSIAHGIVDDIFMKLPLDEILHATSCHF
uniref:Uncharacterized protein n=1 Tax=Clastoptera arizonana TaxID=38151 RepID=A0A1B6DTZ7_9HEMI